MDGRQLLKRYDQVMQQMQHYRARAYHLEGELRVVRPGLHRANQKIDRLQQRVDKLSTENRVLRLRVKELAGKLDQKPRAVPAFVKPDKPARGRKCPGRKKGHEPAHRPIPASIDQHIDVPVPRDPGGVPSCPNCHCQLSDVQHYQRMVEDLEAVTRCYHTVSGYCPGCRKHIESRAPEQPPAADVAGRRKGVRRKGVIPASLRCLAEQLSLFEGFQYGVDQGCFAASAPGRCSRGKAHESFLLPSPSPTWLGHNA